MSNAKKGGIWRALFGCSHSWKRYRKTSEGIHYRCRKCGQLKLRKPSQFWCSHSRMKIDRRRKGNVLVCQRCGKTKKGQSR